MWSFARGRFVATPKRLTGLLGPNGVGNRGDCPVSAVWLTFLGAAGTVTGSAVALRANEKVRG